MGGERGRRYRYLPTPIKPLMVVDLDLPLKTRPVRKAFSAEMAKDTHLNSLSSGGDLRDTVGINLKSDLDPVGGHSPRKLE